MPHLIQCVKIGKELPGLERMPYPGEIGKRLLAQVSQEGWELWRQHAIILINHYGLSLADPQAQIFLEQQMEDFFFGEGGAMPADWSPTGQGSKGTPRK